MLFPAYLLPSISHQEMFHAELIVTKSKMPVRQNIHILSVLFLQHQVAICLLI